MQFQQICHLIALVYSQPCIRHAVRSFMNASNFPCRSSESATGRLWHTISHAQDTCCQISYGSCSIFHARPGNLSPDSIGIHLVMHNTRCQIFYGRIGLFMQVQSTCHLTALAYSRPCARHAATNGWRLHAALRPLQAHNKVSNTLDTIPAF